MDVLDRTLARRITAKYRALVPLMDERMRRQWAATEAQALGWGGVQAVSGALGMSPNTIRKGLGELTARAKHPDKLVSTRLRRAVASARPKPIHDYS